MFEAKREKAELIFTLNHNKPAETCQALLRLLEICIQEGRENNDEAGANDFLRNQGRISAFKDLEGFVKNGLPKSNMPNNLVT